MALSKKTAKAKALARIQAEYPDKVDVKPVSERMAVGRMKAPR